MILRRIGPYHHARFQHASRYLDLHILETRPDSLEDPWNFHFSSNYAVHRLGSPEVQARNLPGRDLIREIGVLLENIAPEYVITVGWADPEYHIALNWAKRNSVPCGVVSDSRWEDHPRNGLFEWFKGSLVRQFDAALAAGTQSRNYLNRLGFPRDRIFTAWDVVDNDYFRSAAEHIRNRSIRPEKYSLPEKYFLCVARFILKKNHEALLQAYARFKAENAGDTHALVLLGAGELEATLRRRINDLGLESSVRIDGFAQYEDLPYYFAWATALILPSHSDQWGLVVNEAMASGCPVIVSAACGCVPDLIEHGVNGFSFNPSDIGHLAGLLHVVAGMPDVEMDAIRRNAFVTIEAYGLQRFTGGIIELIGEPKNTASWYAPLLRWILLKYVLFSSSKYESGLPENAAQ